MTRWNRLYDKHCAKVRLPDGIRVTEKAVRYSGGRVRRRSNSKYGGQEATATVERGGGRGRPDSDRPPLHPTAVLPVRRFIRPPPHPTAAYPGYHIPATIQGASMSQVRLLVGTRKGAFVLTADGKRERWAVRGPHFGGSEIYHGKRSPVDSNRLYASQSSGWFGQVIQRSNDGGKTWDAVGNKFVYDGVPGTVVLRHTPPLGVQARLASRAVAHRSRHCIRRGGRRGDVPHHRRRPELGGALRAARPRHRPQLGARCGWDVPAHDPARSDERRPHLLAISAWRDSARTTPENPEADQPRPQVAAIPRPRSRGGTLCAPSP